MFFVCHPVRFGQGEHYFIVKIGCLLHLHLLHLIAALTEFPLSQMRWILDEGIKFSDNVHVNLMAHG